MAVIDTSWSLTGNDDYDCMRCDFNKEAHTNGKRYCSKTGLTLPNNRKDCPLKSADEMIEEITQYFENKEKELTNEFLNETHSSTKDSCNYGRLHATSRNKECIVEIIYKYCDKEN